MVDGLVELSIEVIEPPAPDILINGDRRFGVIRDPSKIRATAVFEWYDDMPTPPDIERYQKGLRP